MKNNKKSLSIWIIIVLLAVTGSQTLSQNTVGPFSYYPTNQGGSILGQAQIDGLAAATGDIVAAFDSSGECVGAKLVIINSGIAYINMVIYGDDGGGHGMSQGELFYLKIWDASSGQIIEYGTGFSGWQNTNFAPMPGFNNISTVYNFVTALLSVTPASQDTTYSAGNTLFWVTSNTTWTVTESISWFTVSPMSGTNDGYITVTYDENNSTTSRTGQITVTAGGGSQVVNVTLTQTGIEPFVYAGEDATICASGTLSVAGQANAAIEWLMWTSEGDGFFEDENSLNTVYYPGQQDIQNGTVLLCLNGFPIDPELEPVEDCLTLSVQQLATANAGSDATICQTATKSLSGTATHYSNVLWTTSGNGTFSSPSSLTAVYTLGATDITNGSVNLTLMANALSPCTVSASDNMILTIRRSPTANAGADATICQNQTHSLSGTATNQASVLWTTSGNGTFSSTTILNPVYSPGATDITAGTVTLTLTASAITPCTVSATDTKILVIRKTPTANAGTDATICQGSTHTLAGTATNQASVLWTTSGNGTFSSASSLTAVYTPGTMDITNGTVTLTLTASAISPCTISAADTKILTIQKSPTANAGTNSTICQTATRTLSGTATNYSGILWTTTGNGTFSSVTSLSSVYTPGSTDISIGTVTLTLTANPFTPCTVSASHSIIVTVRKAPIANAGNDATICQNQTHTLSGTAQNQLSVQWSTSGNGTFTNGNTLPAVYNPGNIDIANGMVTLTLTANAISPCTVSASDNMVLTIQKEPIVNAGPDFTICEGDILELEGTGENFATVIWTTSGFGDFNPPYGSLNTIYTPTFLDYNKTIELSVYGNPILPCTVGYTDAMQLTIIINPDVDAGNDITITENSQAQLAAIVQNSGSLLWETSGDGTFNNPLISSPVYTPGTSDIEIGIVELCLNASPIPPCTSGSFDCLELTILQQDDLLIHIPSDETIGQYETGIIPLILENPNNEEIEAFDLVIQYNPSVINVSSVTLTNGVLENEDYILQYNTNVPGQVTIVLYAGMNLFTGEGVICYLQAATTGSISDCSDLNFTLAQINEEPVASENGNICIVQSYFTISGNVQYFSNSNPVPGALLTLTGDNIYNALTTTSGDYSYESVIRDDYVSVPAKDDDLGGLSGTDASRIARFSAGLYTLNCMEQIAADVSLSGNISGLDASRVARYSAGVITELNPGIINWVFSTENISNCPLWPPISWTDSLVYADLHKDTTGQDFTAIRLGDVTGNWMPDSKFKNEILNRDEREAAYNPSFDSIQLLVYLDESITIEGVDIALEYDASKLKFVKADFESSIFEGSNYEMQVNEGAGGKLKMVIYALGELYFGDGVLTKITFAVTSENNKPARITLTSLSVNENRVKGWLTLQNEPSNHQFKTESLSIVPDAESSFIAVYPNPFQNTTCISYYLKKQSQVIVQITDINGKLVSTLANEIQNEGVNELTWNGDNDQKQQMPQGVYFAVFKSENSFEVKRIVLIR